MLEQTWQSLSDLIENGGAVMAAIFALSVFIYTLAFRAWMTSQTAAKPIGLVKDGRLAIDNLPQKDHYWSLFRKSFDCTEPNKPIRIHYLSTKKSKFQRTVSSQLSLLKTLAAAAPLLGLLGTLVGMIDTFDALSSSFSGDTATMVAGGISTALLTTNAGLIVAIPAVIIAYLAKRKLEQALIVFSALQTWLETAPRSIR